MPYISPCQMHMYMVVQSNGIHHDGPLQPILIYDSITKPTLQCSFLGSHPFLPGWVGGWQGRKAESWAPCQPLHHGARGSRGRGLGAASVSAGEKGGPLSGTAASHWGHCPPQLSTLAWVMGKWPGRFASIPSEHSLLLEKRQEENRYVQDREQCPRDKGCSVSFWNKY